MSNISIYFILGGFTAEVRQRLSDLVSKARSRDKIRKDPGYGARPSPPADTPAGARPYDPQLAAMVPAWGQGGAKTVGWLDLGDGETIKLISGIKGPSEQMPRAIRGVRQGTPGFNSLTRTHVEGHAAALMRLSGAPEGTLYINRLPCASAPGCDNMLPRMIPQGCHLTIYGPDGYVRVVVGQG